MPPRPLGSPQTQAVLRALLTAHPAPCYGYDLSKATGLKSGSLYPILQRLERLDLLHASWQDSPHTGRPPRHLYSLTAAGLDAACGPARLPTLRSALL